MESPSESSEGTYPANILISSSLRTPLQLATTRSQPISVILALNSKLCILSYKSPPLFAFCSLIVAIAQVCMEHLPLARHCSQCQGHHGEQWTQKSLPSWGFHSSEYQFNILVLKVLQTPHVIMIDLSCRPASASVLDTRRRCHCCPLQTEMGSDNTGTSSVCPEWALALERFE